MRHRFVAERSQSLLLIIDVQKAMLKAIEGWEATVKRTRQLIRAAELFHVPILVTEHYKKGLGETIPEIAAGLKQARFFQKEYFSACLEDDFLDTIRRSKRRQIIVAGMETHVCVLQTVLDLIHSGFQVHIVQNAVASRYPEDRQAALDLFRDAGAVLTTSEIVIFQWIRRANTAEFRQALPIVK